MPELETDPQGKDLLHFELVTWFSIFVFEFYELEQTKVDFALASPECQLDIGVPVRAEVGVTYTRDS